MLCLGSNNIASSILQILEKSDYTMISGKAYIKKSGEDYACCPLIVYLIHSKLVLMLHFMEM